MRKRTAVIAVYLLALHSVAVVAMVSPFTMQRVLAFALNDPTVFDFYRGAVSSHAVQSRSMMPGAIVFFGDSITAGLDTSAVTDRPTENFGIGGDTTKGLLWRIKECRGLQNAGKIVLAVGINDISRYSDKEILDNYSHILDSIPCKVPVVVSAILPLNESRLSGSLSAALRGCNVTNAHIQKVNDQLADLCRTRNNVRFADLYSAMLDEGQLPGRYCLQDGVHLSPDGYTAWSACLQKCVAADWPTNSRHVCASTAH